MMHKRLAIFLVAMIAICSCEKNPYDGGIDTYITDKGEKVVITCIKHNTFQITYKGKEYQIDPVSSAYRPITNYTQRNKADYIIVTHEHYDHFDMHAIFLLTKGTTNILLPPRCYGRYQRGIVIRNGEQAQLDDSITLYAVPAYNTTEKYRLLHPKGYGNGYILDLEGFRIYIAGDTEPIPEMKLIKDIDIAFLPCEKPKTMSPKQLRQVAKLIKPKVVYPCHMGQTDQNEIKKALSGLGIDVKMRMMK